MLNAGAGAETVGALPVVCVPLLSKKRNIAPETSQYDPGTSDKVACPWPSSFNEATLISNV